MTDDDPTPEPFNPSKFVKGLSSAQLEVMSELHDEAAAALRLLTRAGKTFQAPTGKDMLQVFKVAGAELLDRFAAKLQDVDETTDERPQWRSDEAEPQKRIPQTSESEWRRELGYEIQIPRTGLTLPTLATPKDIQDLFDATRDHHRPSSHKSRFLYCSVLRAMF